MTSYLPEILNPLPPGKEGHLAPGKEKHENSKAPTDLVPSSRVEEYLDFIPSEFLKEEVFHTPEFMQLCTAKLFKGDWIERLLFLFSTKSNFNDIVIASGETPLRKLNKRICFLMPRDRLLSRTEMQGFVEHMYDRKVWIKLQEPAYEHDAAYTIWDKEAEISYRFRINICQYQQSDGAPGIKATIRKLSTFAPTYDDLNVPPLIRQYAEARQGLVLVGGETGSGKTTLLAAVIDSLLSDNENHRIGLGYESPIEYKHNLKKHPNVMFQHTVGPDQDIKSFHQGLVNSLRNTPEFVFLGEARDKETFETLPKVAESGTLCLATTHATSIANMFSRIENEVDVERANATRNGLIMYGRLLVVQYLALKKNGGVVPCQEILPMTREVRQYLFNAQKEDFYRHVELAVEKYGQPMKVDCDKHLQDGVISQKTYDQIMSGI